MRERIRRVEVAGVLAVVVALTAASAPRPALRPPATAPLRVDVVGDSLVTQSSRELAGQLAAARFAATIAHRPAQDLGSAFVRSRLLAVRARPPADVLVLATAANDALRDHDRAAGRGAGAAAAVLADQIDRAVGAFADRCVVMVNARVDTASLYHPDHARTVNAVLDRARSRHYHLVVVDWAARSRGVPEEWFAPDQLHFGPDAHRPAVGSGSAREYAAAIVDGIHRCRPLSSRAATPAGKAANRGSRSARKARPTA